MTKIPSVEERVDEFYFRYVIQPLVGSERLDGVAKEAVSFFREALTADRTALLTELRNSELLEEKDYMFEEDNKTHNDFESSLEDHETMGEAHQEGYDTLARAIKAHLDELIKSNK